MYGATYIYKFLLKDIVRFLLLWFLCDVIYACLVTVTYFIKAVNIEL